MWIGHVFLRSSGERDGMAELIGAKAVDARVVKRYWALERGWSRARAQSPHFDH